MIFQPQASAKRRLFMWTSTVLIALGDHARFHYCIMGRKDSNLCIFKGWLSNSLDTFL